MTDKAREEFEAWAMTTGFESHHFTRDADNQYTDYDVRRIWSPWQASRAALVIELPSIKCIDLHGYSPRATLAYCEKAVKASGAKVKL